MNQEQASKIIADLQDASIADHQLEEENTKLIAQIAILEQIEQRAQDLHDKADKLLDQYFQLRKKARFSDFRKIEFITNSNK